MWWALVAGVAPYNERWHHPSRAAWLSAAVQALPPAVAGPPARAAVLFAVDVAANVACCSALLFVILYSVALYFRRQYLATIFPLRAGKVRRNSAKGVSA
jgi:hypothetical protein